VVALRLGHSANPVGELEGLNEVGERVRLLQVMLVYDFPVTAQLLEERGDLVERYRGFLEAQWAAHRALAQHVGAVGGEIVLTAEQLENFKKAFSVCLEAKEYMVKY